MIKRLRNKFVIINMVIVTAMLAVIFFLTVSFMGAAMEVQTRRLMRSVTERDLPAEQTEESPELQRQKNWRPNLIVYIQPGGALDVRNDELFAEVDMETVRQYVAMVQAQETEEGILKAEKLRYSRQHETPCETIVLLDISAEFAAMNHLIHICALISVLSFLLFLAISFALAGWAVRPVEKAWKQQQQFVADASHELKTPLTVIMTNAELLQSPEYTEQERSRFTNSILTMSYQMRGLVESLLELARVDNGTAKMVRTLLDFSELVTDWLLPFEPVYFEKELHLESRIEPSLQVKGSASHLRHVVEILLDNGAKYTAPGGTVVISARRQGNHCLLSVSSPGEAISREDLKNIFKRFYRIDKARAMNHSYGLGLAIADSVVREHKGRIWAESEAGINTFYVQLPATGAKSS